MPGGPNTLSANAYTMGDMFHSLGYATAIFGKWRLGEDPQSLPIAHGFDEYYGVPSWSWDSSFYANSMMVIHAAQVPREVLIAKGSQMVEGRLGGVLHTAKPFTQEVRAEVDNEMADKSIDFIQRQHAAGKPFFLYLPFSTGHCPICPPREFAGKSRFGNYGDKLMEGDYHVGQILDTSAEAEGWP